MPAEMKYGAVRWRQEAAERGHGDPASQTRIRTAVFITRVRPSLNKSAHSSPELESPLTDLTAAAPSNCEVNYG